MVVFVQAVTKWIVMGPRTGLKQGDALALAVDTEHLQLFDEATGRAIWG